MCGIAGVLERRGVADQQVLASMVERLHHRGPDARGLWLGDRGHGDEGVGLGHARLSIIDLAGGAQPMSALDGQVTISFNGEIFNHVELRSELEAKGHRFRTHSDTEVLLRGYLEYGEDVVRELNGQWAFAIWDRRERSFFASRDRLGVRPFYYFCDPARFVFASEIKAIFAHPAVPRRLDLGGIDQVLTYWTTVPPRTAFEGISELPPGHSLRLRDGQVSSRAHFRLDYGEVDRRPAGDLADELRETLISATRLRLERADVPVGAYLSGGLDSSAVTAMASRFTDVPLKTFSVVFEDAEFDESKYQRQVIEHLGVEHHQVLCTAGDIGEAFPDVVAHAEQPIVRTAPTPLFLLSRLVRESGYKVVLTGEGADELLGGYDIFKEAKVRRFWARQPQSKLRPLLLRKLYPYIPSIQKQSDEYLQGFFHARPDDLSNPFFSHLPRWELTQKTKIFYAADVKQTLAARLDADGAYADMAGELPAGFAQWDYFSQAQFFETRYLLPGYILSSQGDRVAMAHSVEMRHPFLDFRVAKLAMRLPIHLRMYGLDEKHLLKRAVADLVPTFLMKRPKQPYRAPDASAFFAGDGSGARFEYIEHCLGEAAIRRTGVFDPRAVGKLRDKADRGMAKSVRDGMALVAILSTQLLEERLRSGP